MSLPTLPIQYSMFHDISLACDEPLSPNIDMATKADGFLQV